VIIIEYEIPPPKIKTDYKKLTFDEDETIEREIRETYKRPRIYRWRVLKRKIFDGIH